MCHPWLAAGLAVFLTTIAVRELGPVLRAPATAHADGATGLLGMRLRDWFRRRMQPFVDLALAAGFTANGATCLQFAMSVTCAIAYGHGWIFTAGLLLIVSGTLDVLDGEMARHVGNDGPRGAFIDSVMDRYGEAVVFAGLASFYRNTPTLWWVIAAWAGSFLVSYTRARAESLGVACNEGLLQRPERYVILGGASMIGTIVNHLTCGEDERHILLTAGVALVALLANLTALQRIRGTLRRLA